MLVRKTKESKITNNYRSDTGRIKWKLLDKELIDTYTNNVSGVKIFASKYNMLVRRVYKRLESLGIKTNNRWKPKEGKDSPNWKGGITKNTVTGYISVYVGKNKYEAQHKLVLEKKLGRKLQKNEIAHHIDESFEARSNNNPDNLKLMIRSKHQQHHNKSKGYAISFSTSNGKNPWRLMFYIGNKQYISAGLYKTKEEALAYKDMCVIVMKGKE